jgi:hypothetical protein
MKLLRLIKVFLNETYSRGRVGKHLSDMFPIMKGLKQGDALSPLLFNFVYRGCQCEVSGQSGWLEMKKCTSASGLG